jgi:hypothetical protein
MDLMLIYRNQYETLNYLVFSAGTLYNLLPGLPTAKGTRMGLMLAASLSVLLCLYAGRKKTLLDNRLIITATLTAALMMPFVLPRMMYRYFFAADVLSIAFAFYFPRLFFVPILIEFASLYSYPRFIPLPGYYPHSYLSVANLTALVFLVFTLIYLSGHSPLQLYRRYFPVRP